MPQHSKIPMLQTHGQHYTGWEKVETISFNTRKELAISHHFYLI